MVVVFSSDGIIAQKEASSDDSVHDVDGGDFVGSEDFGASDAGHGNDFGEVGGFVRCFSIRE